MSASCLLSASPISASSGREVENTAGLDAILQPDVNLAYWRRTVPPELMLAIDNYIRPRAFKRVVSATAGESLPDELLDGLPCEEGIDLLRGDIEHLVRLHTEVTGMARVQVKLETVAGDLCERFHVDRVRLRLICSYAGPGTEWLDDADVNRAYLGPDAESRLLRPGAIVRRMERFAVALMKGERWPGNAGHGLVHRSPRIQEAGQRRVLLKIDAEEPPEHGSKC